MQGLEGLIKTASPSCPTFTSGATQSGFEATLARSPDLLSSYQGELQSGFSVRILDALPGEVAVPNPWLPHRGYGRRRRQQPTTNSRLYL